MPWLLFHYWKLFLSPQACPFQSAVCLLVPFSVSRLLVFWLHPFLGSLIRLPPELYLSVWPPFQLSHVSHSTPQASPIPHARVKLLSRGSDLSGYYQCPGQEPQRRLWLAVSFTHLVQLVTKTWWWYLLNISLVLSTLLLPCLTPSFPIQTSKTTYQ